MHTEIEKKIRTQWKEYLSKTHNLNALIPPLFRGFYELKIEWGNEPYPAITIDYPNKMNFTREEEQKRLEQIDKTMQKMEQIKKNVKIVTHKLQTA